MKQLKTATLLLATAFAATTFGAGAQSLSTNPQRFAAPNDFVPAIFSADNQGHLSFASTDDTKSGSINIYDSSLRLTSSIPITANPDANSKYIYRLRKCEYTWSYVSKSLIESGITKEEARKRAQSWYLEGAVAEKEQTDGSTWFFNAGGTDWRGIPYDCYVFIPTNGNKGDLYESKIGDVDNIKYFDEWEGPFTRIGEQRLESYVPFTIRDFNQGSATLGTATATQTLFNSDPAYEYIWPICEPVTHDEKAEYVHIQIVNPVIVGLGIMSENGTLLQTVRFGEGLRMSDIYNTSLSVLLIGGHRYLSCNVTDGKDYYNLFYEITGGEAGLRQAAEPLKTRVYPTSLSAGESVTIDAGDSQAIFHVHDTAGKDLFSGEIAAGGRTSEVPASAMVRGVNIVTVSTPGNEAESTKVIVK